MLGQRVLLLGRELVAQLARGGKPTDLMLRENEFSVDLHVEDASSALDELRRATELVCEFRGHPGRVRLVVSNHAVFDGNVHDTDSIRRGIGPSQKGYAGGVIVATDVHYESDTEARAAAVVFDRWSDSGPVATYAHRATGFGRYVPGRFYERELPCLLPLLRWVLTAHDIDTVIVDGYVDLGEGPGLGRHLAHALAEDALHPSMVGVAKTAYDGADAEAVLRGTSATPLWVTASTISNAEAADHVRSMDGRHRMPTLLLLVDHIARGHVAPS